ncbi:MAG: exodeoxyribonuclease III [Leptospirales bacterium]|nr:exodeoxyribonuclease III [Leptospirales bacterium]
MAAKKSAAKKAVKKSPEKKNTAARRAQTGQRTPSAAAGLEKKINPVPEQREHYRKPGEIIVYSWNVNGIRAVCRKGFPEWFEKANPDVLCIQETKAEVEQIAKEKESQFLLELTNYDSSWFSAEKKGYSGVATFTKKKLSGTSQMGLQPDHELKFNGEGRVLITTFGDFQIWNAYYPNGGRGPERIEYKLKFYDYCFSLWQEARKHKKLILCGDFNTAHKEIDLARPAENRKNTGFLPEECAFLDRMVANGYVDVFRKFEQGPNWYSYWDQVTFARSRNVGWRIDYFFVTEEALEHVTDAWIEMNVEGSDHCPIGLSLNPNPA